MSEHEQDLNEMLLMRREKLNKMVEDGKNPFEVEKYDITHSSKEIHENFDELEDQTVKIAGRVMSRRGHGKVSFIDVQDESGRIQMFARFNTLGEDKYKDLDCQ